jgi:hypothetical protein
MNITDTMAGRDLEALRAAIAGQVFVPGEAGYDQARQAWNLAVDERPAVVVEAESAADVAQAVRYARAHGMRIAPQGTGHGAEPLEPLDGAMLLRTTRMRTVRIDPATRIARAEAGAVWADVTVPAGQHGLAALAGTSPNVGVTGYTLGGGLGWLARRYGLAANSVTAAELVTPDGDLSLSCTPGTCSSQSRAPRRFCTPGATGPQPYRTRSPPWAACCGSRRCPRSPSRCAAGPSPWSRPPTSATRTPAPS